MKTTIALSLALVALTSARAQIFRPEAVNGAVLGGIAGAIVGNNSGDLRHNAWRGAALGAGVGLLAGEAIGNARAGRRGTQVPVPRGGYIYRDGPGWGGGSGHHPGYHGYGYSPFRHRGHYGWHDSWPRRYGYVSYGLPAYSYYDGYGYGYPYYDSGSYGYYGSRSGAAGGLLLGALAGGIIGHNSGEFRHNGWRGAAWGAGAGWLLGSIFDANRRAVRYAPAPVIASPEPVVQTQQAAPVQQPQQITIINNYYNSSPMSSANGLFGR